MIQNIAFGFGDISRLLRKRFDAAARGIGLTGAQWRVLIAVSKNPGMNQGQLAERLEVEPITVCRMIDRMEQAGLVERRADPQDRRARLLYPAANAADLIVRLEELGRELMDTLTCDLDEADLEILSRTMARIRNKLLDDTAFPPREAGRGRG